MTAFTMLLKLSSVRMMSDASLATSVPAMPYKTIKISNSTTQFKYLYSFDKSSWDTYLNTGKIWMFHDYKNHHAYFQIITNLTGHFPPPPQIYRCGDFSFFCRTLQCEREQGTFPCILFYVVSETAKSIQTFLWQVVSSGYKYNSETGKIWFMVKHWLMVGF